MVMVVFIGLWALWGLARRSQLEALWCCRIECSCVISVSRVLESINRCLESSLCSFFFFFFIILKKEYLRALLIVSILGISLLINLPFDLVASFWYHSWGVVGNISPEAYRLCWNPKPRPEMRNLTGTLDSLKTHSELFQLVFPFSTNIRAQIDQIKLHLRNQQISYLKPIDQRHSNPKLLFQTFIELFRVCFWVFWNTNPNQSRSWNPCWKPNFETLQSVSSAVRTSFKSLVLSFSFDFHLLWLIFC